MNIVIVESPYAGDLVRNKTYLRRCLKSCIDTRQAPFASHAIYPDVLNDEIPELRTTGIEMGYIFWRHAKCIRFFMDYGMSDGMAMAYERAVAGGYPIEIAYIGKNEGEESGEPVFIPSGNHALDSLVQYSLRNSGVPRSGDYTGGDENGVTYYGGPPNHSM